MGLCCSGEKSESSERLLGSSYEIFLGYRQTIHKFHPNQHDNFFAFVISDQLDLKQFIIKIMLNYSSIDGIKDGETLLIEYHDKGWIPLKVSELTYSPKKRSIIETIYHYTDTTTTNDPKTILGFKLTGFSLFYDDNRVVIVDLENDKLYVNGEWKNVQFNILAIGKEAIKCVKQ